MLTLPNESTSYLLDTLNSQNDNARKQSIDLLIKKKKTKLDVCLLIKLYCETNYDDVRLFAIDRLGEMGGDAAPIIPIFIQALTERSLSDREIMSIFRAFGRMKGKAVFAVPHLSERLLSEASSDPIRYCAAEALGKIGEKASEAVPHLIKCLKQEQNIHLRISASEALGRIGSGAKDSISHLIEVCGQKSQFRPLGCIDIESAANALRRIGKHHKEAIKGLYQLCDEYPNLFESLMRKCGPDAVPSLVDDLEKPVDDPEKLANDLEKRGLMTAQELASITPLTEAKDIATKINALFSNKCDAIQRTISKSEDKETKDFAEARYMVLKAVVKTVTEIGALLRAKETAARILGFLGSHAIEAIPALDNVLNSNGVPKSAWAARASAAKTLGAIGKKTPEKAVTILNNALQDPNECVRLAVIGALQGLPKRGWKYFKTASAIE